MSITVKLKDYRSAILNFEKALEKAKLIHKEDAQKAIISVSKWAVAKRREAWGSISKLAVTIV